MKFHHEEHEDHEGNFYLESFQISIFALFVRFVV